MIGTCLWVAPNNALICNNTLSLNPLSVFVIRGFYSLQKQDRWLLFGIWVSLYWNRLSSTVNWNLSSLSMSFFNTNRISPNSRKCCMIPELWINYVFFCWKPEASENMHQCYLHADHRIFLTYKQNYRLTDCVICLLLEVTSLKYYFNVTFARSRTCTINLSK